MNPVHDDDGNVTDYKNSKYSWNAENRMVAAEPKNPSEGDRKTEYLYDYMGRRARKQIFSRNAGNSGWNASPDTEKLFVYDGWNLIKEITKTGASSSDKFYVWGLDLSQSLQGAGGIGGLLCAVHAGEVRHFFFDGNGNVGQVVNDDGSIAAHYEYDPFGNIVNGVSPADDNPFRFSTKYYDAETGLYYYGFRYYSSELGRWWSRDPIEERGGINLYLLLSNNPISDYDLLGNVTVTQIAKVGYQLGLVSDPIVQASSNANFTNLNEKDLIKMNFSNLIKDIQSRLGLGRDGNFGRDTVSAYERWITIRNIKELTYIEKVKFIDSRSPKEILKWIVDYWPKNHQCSEQCPVGYGEVLTMIYYESRDTNVAPNTVYFNAFAGDAGIAKNTAVGLGQISWETSSDAGITAEDRYDAEKNVKGVINLIFKYAHPPTCSFTVGTNKFSAFENYKTEIFDEKGPKINEELGKVNSDPEKVSENTLKSILEMP